MYYIVCHGLRDSAYVMACMSWLARQRKVCHGLRDSARYAMACATAQGHNMVCMYVRTVYGNVSIYSYNVDNTTFIVTAHLYVCMVISLTDWLYPKIRPKCIYPISG